MRCFGLTNKFKRCKNESRYLFCQSHFLQPFVLLLFTVPTIVINFNNIFNIILPHKNILGDHENHLLYIWDSDYAENALNYSLKNKPSFNSRLILINTSQKILKNVSIHVFLYNIEKYDDEMYRDLYNLELLNYTNILNYSYLTLSINDSIIVNLLKDVSNYLEKHGDKLDNITIPDFGKEYQIKVSNESSIESWKNQLFTDNKSLLKIETVGITLIDSLKINGSGGVRLKFLIEYETQKYEYINLLIGGYYYYVNHNSNSFIGLPILVDRLQKAKYTKCREIGTTEYSYIDLPQEIRIPEQKEVAANLFKLSNAPKEEKTERIFSNKPHKDQSEERTSICYIRYNYHFQIDLYNIAVSEYTNKKYLKSIELLNMAINLHYYPPEVYNLRGLCYCFLDDKLNGCSDLLKAKKMGFNKYYNEYCR